MTIKRHKPQSNKRVDNIQAWPRIVIGKREAEENKNNNNKTIIYIQRPSTPTPTMVSTRSTTHEAVQHQRAYNKLTMEEEQQQQQAEIETERTTGNKIENNNKSVSQQQQQQQPPLNNVSILLSSFMEFIFISIYKCMNFGIHFILFISFLALLSIHCFGSFHDSYFVTLLHRARRTDIDLQNELTYYHRQCSVLDISGVVIREVITADADVVDPVERSNNNNNNNDFDPSELFIELPPPELSSSLSNNSNNNNNNKGIKYQQRRQKRRRRSRRFIPSLNSWEEPPILPPISKADAEKSGMKAIKTIMTHGAVMVQQILSDQTIQELRDYIIEKNENVFGTSVVYPMSANHHRISYGIEATEHNSVVRALQEIHDHPIFAHLITNLVGDTNPALSEITAITAWAGAEHQSWHPDVKPDGNGVKFGRTYSHSYSLFLPLQDTTGDMGATDLCPGTHLCASEDLWDVCEANRIGLHDIRPKYTGGGRSSSSRSRSKNQSSVDDDKNREDEDEYEYKGDGEEGIWRAGDGALFNQQVWHRGTAHVDDDGHDRVIFIVSFLSRPVADDPRQLARGTYFHQKWLNWGSTWQDMTDAASSLKRPWNILRCLHLWKSSDRQWGYDLFTATTLRIANAQQGGEPSDLEIFIDNVMTPIHYPERLQGTIDYESDEAWQIYLRETISNTYGSLKKVNYVGHIGFVLFWLVVTSISYLYNRLSKQRTQEQQQQQQHHQEQQQQHPIFLTVFKNGARKLAWTHGSVIFLGLYTWYTVKNSKWATDIDSGKTLMRPFPVAEFIDNDPGVQGGLTTLPRRSDVLIGTRFDTKSIGAYRKWLDYHPGNRIFDEFVDSYGGTFYHSLLYNNVNSNINNSSLPLSSSSSSSLLPVGLTEQLSATALHMIEEQHSGRFLMQDYRTGDWKILDSDEVKTYVRTRLFIGGDGTVWAALKEETNMLLDQYRFGLKRKTRSMSWNSQLFLADLSKYLFAPAASFPSQKETMTITAEKTTMMATTARILSSSSRLSSTFHPQFNLPQMKSIHSTPAISLDENGVRSFLLGKISTPLHVGKEVYCMAWKEKDSGDDDDYDGGEDDDEDEGEGEDEDEGAFALYPGIVTGISTEEDVGYDIAFYDDGVQSLGVIDYSNVPRDLLMVREPTTEGSRVEVQDIDGGYFTGIILLVLADGTVDVKYDKDGRVVTNIPITRYKMMESLSFLRNNEFQLF